jgi:hypothetical protein
MGLLSECLLEMFIANKLCELKLNLHRKYSIYRHELNHAQQTCMGRHPMCVTANYLL